MADLESDPFDVCICVHLNEAYEAVDAFEVPLAAVKRLAYRHARYGWRLPLLKGRLLDDPDVCRLDLAAG